jgi:hypothetical protein
VQHFGLLEVRGTRIVSSTNAENTAEADVSRLTDDQARAIVNAGMALESPPEPDRWSEEYRRLQMAANSEWRKTGEATKGIRRTVILAIAFMLVFIGTACGTFTLIVFARTSWHVWAPVLFAGIIIDVFIGIVITVYGSNQSGKRLEYESSYIANAGKGKDSPKQREPSESPRVSVPEKWLSDPDLQNLLLVNRTQLNVYQDIATKDAKAASRNSRFAIIIGFLILVVGAVVAVRTPNSTSKIVVGALASLGSVLSGYIGQTFLKAQAQAMKQLNYYFRQPLVASYLLSAERIALKLNDENVTKKALLDVIKNVLLAAGRAEELDSASSSTPRRKTLRTSNAAATEEAPPGT